MAITKIRISNFKSFADQTVELHDFNPLVGANASGKSNFVQVFTFLRDIARHGLEDAISLQGGVAYLRNLKIAYAQPLHFHVAVQDESLSARKPGWPLRIHSFEYEFALQFHKEGVGYTVASDRMTLCCSRDGSVSLVKKELQTALAEEKEDYTARSTVEIFNSAGELRMKVASSKSNPPLSPAEINVLNSYVNHSIPEKTLLLETSLVRMLAESACGWFRDIGIYNLDPLKAKTVVPVAGRTELELDGSNLAVVLNRLLADKDSKRSILNICQDYLPFLHNLAVEKVADRSVFLKLREVHSKEEDLPAIFISDGSVNIMGLVVALYFQEEKQLAIFEEPDRHLHPYLLSRVMAMFREASISKQVIATTHNSEMVKHAGLENILLVSRDKNGFSRITKPADSEHVRIFLDNELGIDDLFIDNLLGV